MVKITVKTSQKCPCVHISQNRQWTDFFLPLYTCSMYVQCTCTCTLCVHVYMYLQLKCSSTHIYMYSSRSTYIVYILYNMYTYMYTIHCTCPTRGSRQFTYPHTITRDTGIRLEELAGAMAAKTQWRIRVSSISTAVDG